MVCENVQSRIDADCCCVVALFASFNSLEGFHLFIAYLPHIPIHYFSISLTHSIHPHRFDGTLSVAKFRSR